MPRLHLRWLCDPIGFACLRRKARRHDTCQCPYAGTLAGTIHNVGAYPILVDIDENYHIDLGDLDAKAAESDAKFLLLSHMRVHIADMDKVVKICATRGICLIEDCAHTMEAKWRGIWSANFCKAVTFSTQTYKHMNSSEGGFLTTNDAEIAARAVIS